MNLTIAKLICHLQLPTNIKKYKLAPTLQDCLSKAKKTN
jgi:hypothetical protein